MSMSISEIAAVIPARNESAVLPAALAALEFAMACFARAVPASVTVVLD